MFELLFKYPLSLFHKGHFVLLTPWPLWILGIAIVAGAGLLFFHIHRNQGMLSGLRPIGIWALESVMVALILFLLWHPALSVATLRPQQNVVAVLVDDSRSMKIDDASGTREAAAQAVLNNGLLKSLGEKFQVRLYKFGKEPERIQQTSQLTGSEPATRLGDTLERVLAESSSLPLGAIVLLSDGADNAGGIDLQTIAAIRRQRIPVHTVGFGREHPDKDVEITDAILPARALPQSRLTAVVTFQNYGLGGNKAKLTVKDTGKVLASQEVTLRSDSTLQSESVVFNCGDAGPKSLDISIEPVAGEENTQNNRVTRLVSVEKRTPRILYMEGEPRWDFKFLRRALDDYSGVEIVSLLRTTQNKLYRQGVPDPPDNKELEDGFPTKAEELFRYQGLIIGSVEANYFTVTQQQLIRDFVDRRGGGLLFLGGRASLSDGGYASSSLADLFPTKLPDAKGTFHRDFTGEELTPQGAQSVICSPGRRPCKKRRALEEDAGDGQLPGSPASLNPAPRCCWNLPRRAATSCRCWSRKITGAAARCFSPPAATGAGKCGPTMPTRPTAFSGSRYSATW